MVKDIQGGVAQDERGQIRFVNDFDMTDIKRFYIIKNIDTSFVRGWRGHRIEQRWLYAISGAFSIDIVKIDDWASPSRGLNVENRIVDSTDLHVLHIAAGYATTIRALEEGSELLVYSDYPVSHAPLDNYTFSLDYFVNRR
ncbi:WxcM-like domain-containing protein [Sphingobacterium sp. SG20118]|uniref:WxcM-like domain-containing protein n=1 Tax=Sphingobacterium sp. SG20118 TaxID=3367156 RepID=UPI0037DFC516